MPFCISGNFADLWKVCCPLTSLQRFRPAYSPYESLVLVRKGTTICIFAQVPIRSIDFKHLPRIIKFIGLLNFEIFAYCPHWKVWQFSTKSHACKYVLVARARVQSMLKCSIKNAPFCSMYRLKSK